MNKFTISFIFIAILSLVGVGVYTQLNKEAVPGKAKRLPCMSKVTSFERSYGIEDIQKAQAQIENGNFSLSSDIDKAIFMNSTLFDYVDMKKIDQVALDTLNSFVKNKTTHKKQPLKVLFTVFENDRDDPKKKSKNCKLYRGYVVFKFKNEKNKIVYQNQIDFLDPQGADVAQTISCAINAFMTYNIK